MAIQLLFAKQMSNKLLVLIVIFDPEANPE